MLSCTIKTLAKEFKLKISIQILSSKVSLTSHLKTNIMKSLFKRIDHLSINTGLLKNHIGGPLMAKIQPKIK